MHYFGGVRQCLTGSEEFKIERIWRHLLITRREHQGGARSGYHRIYLLDAEAGPGSVNAGSARVRAGDGFRANSQYVASNAAGAER